MQARSNLIRKTRPEITFLHPQVSTFPPTMGEKKYKSSTISTPIPEEIGARTPVEIGTRGTVGSLIMKEIEHFSQLELGCGEKFEKKKLASLVATPKKKRKKKRRSKLIPRMCSLVEVAESTRPNMILGFNYKNLKADDEKRVAGLDNILRKL